MIYDVIIIGAGAAGLFAAANIREGISCLVLEKGNSPGKKLLLAGSGQCNITHSGSIRDFQGHYGAHGKTIRPILYQFGNRSVMKFFEDRGVPLLERPDGKVFPKTLNSEDILLTLIGAGEENNVCFAYGAGVTDIYTAVIGEESVESGACGSDFVYTVVAGGVSHRAKRVIVATGGKSFAGTGSDGSIMPILEALGQPIVPQRPALAPIFTQSYPYSRLSGISFRDIRASIVSPGCTDGCNPKKRGDLLLTHRGFSGPLILELSRYATPYDALNINYLPGLDTSEVYRSISHASTGSLKQFSTVLMELFGDRIPARFADAVAKLVGINPAVKASTVPGNMMKRLSAILTGDMHQITSVGGFESAMVTAGGVSLEGVDLSSLQSKVCPGLYFAGEILDVDGDTGGYNLQFAFSSGYLASRLL